MLEDVTQETVKRLRERTGPADRHTLFVVFQGSLPTQAVADRMAWLNVRDEERILFVAVGRESEEALTERLLLALDKAGTESRIVEAWWEENTLVVVSPTAEGFRRLRVPLEKLVLQRYGGRFLVSSGSRRSIAAPAVLASPERSGGPCGKCRIPADRPGCLLNLIAR
jgi:hypothetical protein